MTRHELLTHYLLHCRKTLEKHTRAQQFLKNHGIFERSVLDSYAIGYSDASIESYVSENESLGNELEEIGLLRGKHDVFKGCIIIRILDDNKEPENIIGYSIYGQRKNRLMTLSSGGIFNAPFLKHAQTVYLTNNPLHALFLMAMEMPATTFLYGDEKKYLAFFRESGIRSVVFTHEDSARLFSQLEMSGISTQRASVDFERVVKSADAKKEIKEFLQSLNSSKQEAVDSNDFVEEIEHGYLFRLPLLTYRVLGNFTDFSMTMKVNIRAMKDDMVFVDSVDLYRNRDRRNFIFNLTDQFNIRDQVQLEQDLQTILTVIETRKEQQEKARENLKIELTDHERSVGMEFLAAKDLCNRIIEDYDRLGYVRERKNKLLLYLVMTSRLMDSPLHTLILARSSAGKSRLAEITEELCPPESVVSVSDLSQQAMFYWGEDDLKHRFVAIGERQGSETSDYPLRELISRKSITKAIPLKDPISGQIKTTTITVNGPIALVETSTSTNVNPENLNRCFIIGIDESEEQTSEIHRLQRHSFTIDGFLKAKEREEITGRHICAQRLLRSVQVFNPFAELLSFPSSKLRSRRDNEKFLRLISAICFLHQYQRPVKKLGLKEGEEIEYIECTVDDYRTAYELLADGILDNTLDDLPRPARSLLDLICELLRRRSTTEGVPVERIVFERKEIREYTSWTFAQIRNNFRILKDYEYLKLIKGQNGQAHKYRLASGYTGVDLLHTILSPEELERQIKSARRTHPTDTEEVHEPEPVYAVAR